MIGLAKHFALSVKIGLLVACTAVSVQGVHKIYITSEQAEALCDQLFHMIKKDNFEPDLIIGLSRGGLVPLGYLAGEKLFDVRTVYSLGVQSYDRMQQGNISLVFPFHIDDIKQFHSILVIDDIVDTGKTIAFVKELFEKHGITATVKFAALYYKSQRSFMKPDYYVEETDDWVVFPWQS